MLTPDTLYSIIKYSVDEYPFIDRVCEAIDEWSLSGLEDVCPLIVRETDQQTKWHRRFYENSHIWKTLYKRFIKEFIAKQISEPFYYQAIPTFRVQLPNNLAVGEFHRDRDYGHPNGEINFWLPLTVSIDTNTVHLANYGVGRPINSYIGEVVIFDAVNTPHGNYVNLEGHSRVSFDFRILPVRLYKETDARTINTKVRFAPGEYYESERCIPRP